jgi:hypothetical protein
MSDFAPEWIDDPAIRLADDGSPMVPADPRLAAARLKLLESVPGIVDVLLDRGHPMHKSRADERKALLVVASGKPYGSGQYKSVEQERLDEKAKSYRTNVLASMPTDLKR